MHFCSASRKLVLIVFAHFVDFPRAALGGGLFSRITTLFGTAVQAARSSEEIFTSSFFCFVLVFMWGSALLTRNMRMCVDSIMKLDQESREKSKVKSQRAKGGDRNRRKTRDGVRKPSEKNQQLATLDI